MRKAVRWQEGQERSAKGAEMKTGLGQVAHLAQELLLLGLELILSEEYKLVNLLLYSTDLLRLNSGSRLDVSDDGLRIAGHGEGRG
jgi:hypothetical protein